MQFLAVPRKRKNLDALRESTGDKLSQLIRFTEHSEEGRYHKLREKGMLTDCSTKRTSPKQWVHK